MSGQHSGDPERRAGEIAEGHRGPTWPACSHESEFTSLETSPREESSRKKK